RHHNDGNGTDRLPQRSGTWRPVADEYVGRERHQFCCVSPYAAGVAPTKACLDLDVATVCPTQLFQALLKRCHSGLSFPIVGDRKQHADPPHGIGLLCARRERRRDRRAAEQRDEVAPFHLRGHSMTSSARARSVGGTSKWSARAVLRLITS